MLLNDFLNLLKGRMAVLWNAFERSIHPSNEETNRIHKKGFMSCSLLDSGTPKMVNMVGMII